MENIPTKIDGVSTLPAAEFNQMPTEMENLITDTGIVLSGGDLSQMSKSVSNYVATGDFYTDSGAANAYILLTQGDRQAPTSYTDGFRARFVAGNDNTGASSINVASIGSKDLVDQDGSVLTPSEIKSGVFYEVTYLEASDHFIVNPGSARRVTGLLKMELSTFTDETTITGRIDADNSIPQSNEGQLLHSFEFTPVSSSSTIEVEYAVNVGTGSGTNGATIVSAMFVDSETDAAMAGITASIDGITLATTRGVFTNTSTAARTYHLRMGVGFNTNNSGHVNSNISGGAVLGGKLASYIKVTEYRNL